MLLRAMTDLGVLALFFFALKCREEWRELDHAPTKLMGSGKVPGV